MPRKSRRPISQATLEILRDKGAGFIARGHGDEIRTKGGEGEKSRSRREYLKISWRNLGEESGDHIIVDQVEFLIFASALSIR